MVAFTVIIYYIAVSTDGNSCQFLQCNTTRSADPMIFWFYTSWAGELPVLRSLVRPVTKVQPERPPMHVGCSPQAPHSGVSTGLASVPAPRPRG